MTRNPRCRHLIHHFIDRQHAVRQKALHGERPGNAYFLFVIVRFVIQIFDFRLGGNGGVDFLLALDVVLPPLGMQGFRFFLSLSGYRPSPVRRRRGHGDFPFFPFLAKQGIELCADGFELFLPLFPDHVDFGIVGNGLQINVRDSLIDKTLSDVATCGCGG